MSISTADALAGWRETRSPDARPYLPQGHTAADPVSGHSVDSGLARPGEHRVREAADAGRPQVQRSHLRTRCRYLLPWLLLLRGAEQSAARKVRRQEDDHAHHHRLGHHVDHHDVRHDAGDVLFPALPARRVRSRLLSRDRALSHVLVSHGPQSEGIRHVHVGFRAGRRDRRAARRRDHEQPERSERLERMAVAVPARRHSLGDCRHRHFLLPDRQTGTGEVAHGRREASAARRPRQGQPGSGASRAQHHGRAQGPPGMAADRDLLLPVVRQFHAYVLGAERDSRRRLRESGYHRLDRCRRLPAGRVRNDLERRPLGSSSGGALPLRAGRVAGFHRNGHTGVVHQRERASRRCWR